MSLVATRSAGGFLLPAFSHHQRGVQLPAESRPFGTFERLGNPGRPQLQR